MVIDSLNLKLRQIVTFSSNMTFFDSSTRRKTTLPHTMVTSRYLCKQEVFLLKFFPHIFFLQAFVRQEDFRRTFAY